LGIAQPVTRGLSAHGFRREAVVGRVWPHQVVVPPPSFDDDPGLGKAGEDFLIETFVTEAVIEAFNEGILHGLARRDVMPFDAGSVGPLEHGPRGQLAAVDGHDHGGPATSGHEGIELAHDTDAADRCIDRQGPQGSRSMSILLGSSKACTSAPPRASAAARIQYDYDSLVICSARLSKSAIRIADSQ
jgi:hypothetical protein